MTLVSAAAAQKPLRSQKRRLLSAPEAVSCDMPYSAPSALRSTPCHTIPSPTRLVPPAAVYIAEMLTPKAVVLTHLTDTDTVGNLVNGLGQINRCALNRRCSLAKATDHAISSAFGASRVDYKKQVPHSFESVACRP